MENKFWLKTNVMVGVWWNERWEEGTKICKVRLEKKEGSNAVSEDAGI